MRERARYCALALLVLFVHLAMAIGASAGHTCARVSGPADSALARAPQAQRLLASVHTCDGPCAACTYMQASRAAQAGQAARPPLTAVATIIPSPRPAPVYLPSPEFATRAPPAA